MANSEKFAYHLSALRVHPNGFTVFRYRQNADVFCFRFWKSPSVFQALRISARSSGFKIFDCCTIWIASQTFSGQHLFLLIFNANIAYLELRRAIFRSPIQPRCSMDVTRKLFTQRPKGILLLGSVLWPLFRWFAPSRCWIYFRITFALFLSSTFEQ